MNNPANKTAVEDAANERSVGFVVAVGTILLVASVGVLILVATIFWDLFTILENNSTKSVALTPLSVSDYSGTTEEVKAPAMPVTETADPEDWRPKRPFPLWEAEKTVTPENLRGIIESIRNAYILDVDIENRISCFNLNEFAKRVESECMKSNVPFLETKVEHFLGEILSSSPFLGLQNEFNYVSIQNVSGIDYVVLVDDMHQGLVLDSQYQMEIGSDSKVCDVLIMENGIRLSQLVMMHMDKDFAESYLTDFQEGLARGMSYLMVSDFKTARKALLPLLDMKLPEYLSSLKISIRGVYLTELHNFAAAVSEFKSCPTLLDLPMFARCNYAQALAATGDLVKAREILDSVTEEHCKVAYMLANIEIYLASGQLEKASEEFEYYEYRTPHRASRFNKFSVALPGVYNPNDVDFIRSYGYSLYLENNSAALKAFCNSIDIIKLHPSFDAILVVENGDLDAGISLLRDSHITRREYFWYQIYADLLIRKGDPELLLTLDPDDMDYEYIVRSLHQSKRPELPDFLEKLGNRILEKDPKQFLGTECLLNSLMKKKSFEEVLIRFRNPLFQICLIPSFAVCEGFK